MKPVADEAVTCHCVWLLSRLYHDRRMGSIADLEPDDTGEPIARSTTPAGESYDVKNRRYMSKSFCKSRTSPGVHPASVRATNERKAAPPGTMLPAKGPGETRCHQATNMGTCTCDPTVLQPVNLNQGSFLQICGKEWVTGVSEHSNREFAGMKVRMDYVCSSIFMCVFMFGFLFLCVLWVGCIHRPGGKTCGVAGVW
jgi:hypothetical protein